MAWVRVVAPTLGELSIPAGSEDFLDWIRSGLKAARWPDGPSLARDLLATQARTQRDADPLGGRAARALTPDQLDQFAHALLTATGSNFRPRTVTKRKGVQQKIRKRRTDEADGLAAREGERGADRLKRVLEAWVQDRADFNTLMARQIGLSTTQLAESLAAAGGITKMLDSHRRLAGIVDPVPGIAAAMKAIQSPTYASLLAAIKPSPAMDAVRAIMFQPSGILAQIQAQQTRMTEITRLATLPRTDVLAGLKLYPNLATDLASRLSIGAGTTGSSRALAKSLAIPSAIEALGLKSLANQAGLAAAIGRQFDLRIPATTLAAMSALSTSSVIADAVRAQSFFPPGFQMAAALGLENSVARGLVADILHHYDAATPDAPAFADALGSTAIVDAGTLTEAEAVSFLQRVAGWLMAAITAEVDIVRRNGLVYVLTFIMTLVATYYGHGASEIGRESLAVAKESLVVAKSGASHDDMTALIKETHAVGEAVRAEQRGDARAHDRIRYVHDRTPLRAEPQARGLLLRVIYPDQLLQVIEERGDWLEVEAFNYSTDAPIRGWVSRRRLRLTPQR